MKKEFEQFQQTKEERPPESLSDQVKQTVYRELNPSPATLFLKISLIQTIVGAITLLVCPQFGVSFTKLDIFQWIYQISPHLCMIACGLFFMGSSLVVAALALSMDELRTMRKLKFIYIIMLSGLTLMAFHLIGGHIHPSMTFFWLIGAICGGVILFELSHKVRLSYLSV